MKKLRVFSIVFVAMCCMSTSFAYDINNDGYDDIVISNYKSGSTRATNSYIYWGTASGLDTSTPTGLPTVGAYSNSVADLNDDGYLDIVFSNYHDGSTVNINSYIYWGTDSGMDMTPTELATHGAVGSSVADINADGYLDIVFSNFSNGSTVNTNSYVYWGSASGINTTTPTQLATHGAYDNSIADINNDGYLDILFCNANAGGSAYNINSYIYWGTASGIDTTPTGLPTMGAHGSSIADINDDGYLDIVFSNSYNGSTPYLNSYIYWGTASGIDMTPTGLPTVGAYGNSVGDINGDGYLDIVFANYSNWGSVTLNSYIYWGTASGIDMTPTGLPTVGAISNVITDVDNDGYMDIIFAHHYNGSSSDVNSYIYWGTASGMDMTPTELATHGAMGISAGDMSGYGQSYVPVENIIVPEPMTVVLLMTALVRLIFRFKR